MMFVLAVTWLLPLLSRVANAQAAAPIVDLGYVKYSGLANSTAGINYYRGIRYAQPPTGSNRFKAPLPIEQPSPYKPDQVVDVAEYQQWCFQTAPLSLLVSGNTDYDTAHPQGEDCLFLDILVPQRPAGEKLPVTVQIHGGGYNQGWSTYDPGDAFTHHANGSVIWVQIQYRLGAFGFLGGDDITQHGSLNNGLLDQRLALEWVQKHIGAFGGDPSQINIWGGSAGGGSVALQMTAYGGRNSAPFSSVIAEYPWWTPFLTKRVQEHQYNQVLSNAGCTNLACLLRLDGNTLANATQGALNSSYPSAQYGYGLFWYGPVVDGNFVQQLPQEAFQQGNFHQVPLLVNHETYEGYVFSNKTSTSIADETRDAQLIFPEAGPSFFSRLYSLYPGDAYNSTLFQRQTWFGDFIINCPTYYMATASVDHLANPSSVFKMIFNANGGTHASTKALLFSQDIDYGDTTDKELAYIMSDYYLSFIVNQDPNPGRRNGTAYWPSYSSQGDDAAGLEQDNVGFRAVQVDPSNAVFAVSDPDAGPTCDFWGSQSSVIKN